MIDSHLVHTTPRTALPAPELLRKKSLAAMATLALALMGALVAVAGCPSAFAEPPQQVATHESQPAAGRVNINSADAKTLAEKLRGVGETRAMEIVRHRETYGPFASAEELTEVKGIGQSTLDRNRDLITLE